MEEIRNLLNEVKHPEINNSLVELQMIGDIKEEDDKVTVELKLPIPGIPIKQMLIDLIKNKLEGKVVEVKTSVMSQEERDKFFELSRQNWAL